jgi:hypothetical protein
VNLPHLAQRCLIRRWRFTRKAEVIMASVMDRFGISRIESSLAMEDDDWYGYDDKRGRESKATPDMTTCWGCRYPDLRYAGSKAGQSATV